MIFPEATVNYLIAVIVLILWTLAVTYYMGYRRYTSVQKRVVDPRYYQVYQGEGEPEALAKISRHYVNLHENPVLFYALSAVILALGVADYPFVILAWLYVAARIAHSIVHLTFNHVLVRFLVFGVGVTIVAVMALRLLTMVL